MSARPRGGAPPRVTAIVPMHNSRPYLDAAIESIIAQTYDDWEAVLVDDASEDDTYERALALARREPERISVVRLERNVGVAAARNTAVERSAGGELIALLDHDDYWLEDYLERMVELYEGRRAKGRRIGVVACDALIHGPEGITGETAANRFGYWVDEVDLDAMLQRNRIFARAVFARAAYDEVGGFSPGCPGFDDYDLWLRIMEAGYEVVATRDAHAVYRWHSRNMSANDLLMSDGAIAALSAALRRGALSRGQRRTARRRLRHYRALRQRALVRRALGEGRPLQAAGRSALAAPLGAIAFIQQPSRWAEWIRDALRRTR